MREEGSWGLWPWLVWLPGLQEPSAPWEAGLDTWSPSAPRTAASVLSSQGRLDFRRRGVGDAASQGTGLEREKGGGKPLSLPGFLLTKTPDMEAYRIPTMWWGQGCGCTVSRRWGQ